MSTTRKSEYTELAHVRLSGRHVRFLDKLRRLQRLESQSAAIRWILDGEIESYKRFARPVRAEAGR